MGDQMTHAKTQYFICFTGPETSDEKSHNIVI